MNKAPVVAVVDRRPRNVFQMSATSLTSEQYLALSTLAYAQGLEQSGRNLKISLLRSLSIEGINFSSLEMKALADLDSWILINAYTSPSGMSAIALQNPETKEIVFAYRGTNGILGNLEDWLMNLKIAVGANLTIDNGKNQFIDALNFYYDTVQKAGGASNITKRSFTGHSLGGGIAQYIEFI